MRTISWFGPTAAELVGRRTWMVFTFLFSLTRGVTFNPVALPDLDLSQLGRVAITGDFDAISLFSYREQNQNGFSTNGTQSLIVQLPNGKFASSAATDASIKSLCPFVMDDGTLAGVVVGGNFTSLGGIEAQGIAMFDPSTSQITPLPGLSGQVSAILCDQDTNTVYVGGEFTGAKSTNAIAWVGMTGWANLPFAGFNGPVNSIAKAANGNVVFGGSFTGLGNATTSTKKHQQVINLSTATITSGSSTSLIGFDDPRNIVCGPKGQEGAGNTWWIEDDTPGSWRADMNFGYEPSMLRLWNAHQDGRGTQTFRFTASPSGGIMNFTYTDPATGNESVCDARCPLSDDPDIEYQDFRFVNNVGMNGFQIDVSDWYGKGGGLAGIELFQNEIYAYAVADLNEPDCANIKLRSNATATGPWTVTPSGNSTSQYLTVDLTRSSTSSDQVSIVFEPDIKQSGNYSVTIFTPGCLQDSSCEVRGIANITGVFATQTQPDGPVQTQIYQTNDFDKYDEIYYGYVDANSDSFRAKVTLAPLSNQGSGSLLVAQRVRFALTNSTGGLNGLFEFNPNQPISDAAIADSTINESALDLDLDATVTSLLVVEDVTYIAGNFSAQSNEFRNVFAISEGNSTALPNRGLNAEVSTIVKHDDLLFFGGSFTNTTDASIPGLNHIAIFNRSSRSWQALGAGVNGRVNTIVPMILNITNGQPETCLTVNGDFDQIAASAEGKAVSVDGFAIWVPSRQKWLPSLNVQTQAINGKLSASTNLTGSTPLLAGTIAVQDMNAGGAATLTSDPLRLNPVPIKIQPRQLGESSRRKRAVSGQNVTGVVTGLFYKSGNRNITILGGHFTADATNGSTIENLAFVDQKGDVTGIESGLDADSVFLALATQNNILYAGGTISGKLQDNNVNGLILYDLAQNNYASPQPPAFGGDDVAVNSITIRPKTTAVYVGGNFQTAGDLDCPSVCMFENGQWSQPGRALDGSVAALLWQGTDSLLAGGNLTVNGNATSLATYNAKKSQWTPLDGASSDVPGPVTALSPANNDGSQFWVAGKSSNGSAFLMKYDGSKLLSLGDTFGKQTTIRGLNILQLKKNHESNEYVDRGVVLLVTGELNLPNFGNASAALFNGTNFTPFMLSTSANGPGSVSQLFSEKVLDFKSSGGHKALGLVVLVALACALGAIFLLIVAGIFVERYRRKHEGYTRAPTTYPDKTSNIGRIPPEHLFGRLGQGYRADAPML